MLVLFTKRLEASSCASDGTYEKTLNCVANISYSKVKSSFAPAPIAAVSYAAVPWTC